MKSTNPFSEKKRNRIFLVPLLGLSMFLVTACSNNPQPIAYGHDACSFCEMTIVASNFSAQAVSTKGKQYKYDSVECLVHHLAQVSLERENLWVADYQDPGVMIEAQKASFIINDSLKSPMGANLAAIRYERNNTLNWEELQRKLLHEPSSPSTQMDMKAAEPKNHH